MTAETGNGRVTIAGQVFEFGAVYAPRRKAYK